MKKATFFFFSFLSFSAAQAADPSIPMESGVFFEAIPVTGGTQISAGALPPTGGLKTYEIASAKGGAGAATLIDAAAALTTPPPGIAALLVRFRAAVTAAPAPTAAAAPAAAK